MRVPRSVAHLEPVPEKVRREMPEVWWVDELQVEDAGCRLVSHVRVEELWELMR